MLVEELATIDVVETIELDLLPVLEDEIRDDEDFNDVWLAVVAVDLLDAAEVVATEVVKTELERRVLL